MPSDRTHALPGVFSLWLESWALYRERFWLLFTISLVPSLIALVGMLILPWLLLDVPSFMTQAVGYWLGVVLAVVLMVIQVWGQVALLYAVKHHESRLSWLAIYNAAWPLLGSFVILSLLASLIVWGGFMLFVVPAIILAFSFAFATYVLIDEKVGGLAALDRSTQYVSSRRGAVIGRLLGLVGIIIVISVITSSLFGAITGYDEIISTVLDNLVNAILLPMGTIYGYKLYEAVKKVAPTPHALPKLKRIMLICLAVVGPILGVLFAFILPRLLDQFS